MPTPGGQLLWVDRAWRERLGWSLEDMAGRDMLAEFDPDAAERADVCGHMHAADSQWRADRHAGPERRADRHLVGQRPAVDGTTIAIGQDVSERERGTERALG